MRHDPEDGGDPTSWRAVLPGTPVISSDGQQVGTAGEVLGWDQEDIFHGIVIDGAGPDDRRLIAARHIQQMTRTAIFTDLSVDEIARIEQYAPPSDLETPEQARDEYLHPGASE